MQTSGMLPAAPKLVRHASPLTSMLDRRSFLQEASGACIMACGALVNSFPLRGGPSRASPLQGAYAGQQQSIAGVPVCWCPPGRFLMGSPPTESGRRPDEAQVEVFLSRGFWMGQFEVTQAVWFRVMADPPERPLSSAFGLGDGFPIYWVTFFQAERFCQALTTDAHRRGVLPPNWAFRLPTEAQWEYACRAGSTTATAFGEEVLPHQINFGHEFPTRADARRGAAQVGSYPANGWGIWEMHGNVWEWCRDWYHARLPGGTDPDMSERPGVRNRDGTFSRVRRGGAWIEPGWACRSAARLRYEPDRSSDHIGFRVAVVPL